MRRVSLTEYSVDCDCGREPFDPVEAGVWQTVRDGCALRRKTRLSAQRQRLGDERIALDAAEHFFPLVVDRLRQIGGAGERDGVARRAHHDLEAFVRPFMDAYSLSASGALAFVTLTPSGTRNGIAGGILGGDDDGRQRLVAVDTRIGVALLEFERDVHEAHLRFAFDRLCARKPEPSLVQP